MKPLRLFGWNINLGSAHTAKDADDASSANILPANAPTHFSATVFSGQQKEWINYLNMPRAKRHDGPFRFILVADAKIRQVVLHGQDGLSIKIAEAMNDAFAKLFSLADQKPFVAQVLDELIFGKPSKKTSRTIQVVSSGILPCEATRESFPGTDAAMPRLTSSY